MPIRIAPSSSRSPDCAHSGLKHGTAKQPFFINLTDDSIFAFAGLWASWHDPASDKGVETYTIITTTPNALMAPIHNRMPVILQREHEEPWLDPDITDPLLLHSFLQPYPAKEMQAVPVSPAVSAVNVNNEILIQPINDHPLISDNLTITYSPP